MMCSSDPPDDMPGEGATGLEVGDDGVGAAATHRGGTVVASHSTSELKSSTFFKIGVPEMPIDPSPNSITVPLTVASHPYSGAEESPVQLVQDPFRPKD
jgi:hypothetical protein